MYINVCTLQCLERKKEFFAREASAQFCIHSLCFPHSLIYSTDFMYMHINIHQKRECSVVPLLQVLIFRLLFLFSLVIVFFSLFLSFLFPLLSQLQTRHDARVVQQRILCRVYDTKVLGRVAEIEGLGVP